MKTTHKNRVTRHRNQCTVLMADGRPESQWLMGGLMGGPTRVGLTVLKSEFAEAKVLAFGLFLYYDLGHRGVIPSAKQTLIHLWTTFKFLHTSLRTV